MRSFREFLKDVGGNIATLSAAGFSLATGAGALAIDVAYINQQQQVLQAAADIAAMEAAYTPHRSDEAIQAYLARTPWLSTAGVLVEVETGTYTPTTAKPIAERFKASTTRVNAVRVRMVQEVESFFLPSQGPISVTATAATTPSVSMSIGSGLLSLEGGVANALLDKLLGGRLNLDLLHHAGLARVDVDLLEFLDRLAISAGIRAVTYDDVLDANIRIGDLADALSAMTNGPVAAEIARLRNDTRRFRVRDLVDLGRYGGLSLEGSGPLVTRIGVLDILTASALLANGSKQIDLNLGAALPGLLGIDLSVGIGEGMQHAWFVLGTGDALVRTAQLRLRLGVRLDLSLPLLPIKLNIPLAIDVASAEARPTAATCPDRHSAGSAIVATHPAVVRVALSDIGTDSPFPAGSTSVRILDTLLARAVATAKVELSPSRSIDLSFASTDIENAVVKRASASAQGTMITHLISTLDIDVQVLGLGLPGKGLISSTIKTGLMAVAPTLDLVVVQVLKTLGISIGTADVVVHAVACDRVGLVQ